MKVELTKQEVMEIIAKSFPDMIIRDIEFNMKRTTDSSIIVDMVSKNFVENESTPKPVLEDNEIFGSSDGK